MVNRLYCNLWKVRQIFYLKRRLGCTEESRWVGHDSYTCCSSHPPSPHFIHFTQNGKAKHGSWGAWLDLHQWTLDQHCLMLIFNASWWWCQMLELNDKRTFVTNFIPESLVPFNRLSPLKKKTKLFNVQKWGRNFNWRNRNISRSKNKNYWGGGLPNNIALFSCILGV